MPVQILSDAEREAWSRFPERIEEDALGAFFTLTAGESEAIRRLYGRSEPAGGGVAGVLAAVAGVHPGRPVVAPGAGGARISPSSSMCRSIS